MPTYKDYMRSKKFDESFTDVNKELHQKKVMENSIEPTDLLPVSELERQANKILASLHAPIVSVAKAFSSLFHKKPDTTKEPAPTQDNSPKKRF